MKSYHLLGRFLKTWWAVIAGLIFSVSWFTYAASLSPEMRGLQCCDAQGYTLLSALPQVWNYAGIRTFGYPLFLAIFYRTAVWQGTFTHENYDWVTLALWVQLLVWLATCFILFFSMRSQDKHYRYGALGLLLAHPALAAYSALTLTEALATSFFTLAMVCVWKLSFVKRRFWLWSLLASLTLGYATSMRPTFLAILPLTGLSTGGVVLWRGKREGWTASRMLAVSMATWLTFLVGTLPTVGKAVYNCTTLYGQVCIVHPATALLATEQSISLGLSRSRVWTSLRMGARGSGDTLIARLGKLCDDKLGPRTESSNSYTWLLKCYASYPTMVPPVLLKKLIAAYDHHHLNGYTADTTTRFEFYLNKIYSLGNLLGFFFAIGLCVRHFLHGTLYKNMHLILSIFFVLVLLNYHIEARYFFPTSPIFILTFLSGLSKLGGARLQTKLAVSVMSMVLITASLIMSHQWYLNDCVDMHERIPHEARVKGLITDCAPIDVVRQELAVYDRYTPTWPPRGH